MMKMIRMMMILMMMIDDEALRGRSMKFGTIIVINLLINFNYGHKSRGGQYGHLGVGVGQI